MNDSQAYLYGEVATSHLSSVLRGFGLRNFERARCKAGAYISYEQFASVTDAKEELRSIRNRFTSDGRADSESYESNVTGETISYDSVTISLCMGIAEDEEDEI